MTTKKYLTTPEEILALKDTDTKIHVENIGGYYKFIQGTLCYFPNAGEDFEYQSGLWKSQIPYILVEESVKDANENDIGKLCKFWGVNPSDYLVGFLCEVDFEKGGDCPYCMDGGYGCWYEHCHPLSPTELAEITGYKVEE